MKAAASRALRDVDVGHDASDDEHQSANVVEVVVHQVGKIAYDEQQCAEHDEDDTDVLFHSSYVVCLCLILRVCSAKIQKS